MTFSIVGRSADGSSVGVAVASKFLAVGAAVPAAEVGAGAIATQSYANLAYRPDGLAMLRGGRSAPDTVAALTAADDLREQRQVGVVDAEGRSASFTGQECNPWAGGCSGPDYAIQGNILTGPEVVTAMERAWLASDPSAPLGRRLLAALTAGDQAGGDRRGRQSAALYVVQAGGGYGGGSDVYADLRVDDHPNPVPELVRLLGLHDLFFGRPDPDALRPLEGKLLEEVNGLLVQVGHPPAGEDTGRTRCAVGLGRGGEPRGARPRLAGDRPGGAGRPAAQGIGGPRRDRSRATSRVTSYHPLTLMRTSAEVAVLPCTCTVKCWLGA